MDAASVSLAGMNAATMGVAVVANNVANANSKDYRAKRLDFEDLREGGVKPSQLRESEEAGVPGGTPGSVNSWDYVSIPSTTLTLNDHIITCFPKLVLQKGVLAQQKKAKILN
jgi:hypothetical protein